MSDGQYEALKQSFDKSPYAMFLGMRLIELDRGYCKISLEVKKDFHNWDNITHGGLVSSLLDHAFGCSLNTLERRYVAVQLSVNFMGTPKENEVITCEGRVVHSGISLGIAHMVIKDSCGKTIGSATGTALGMERQEPI